MDPKGICMTKITAIFLFVLLIPTYCHSQASVPAIETLVEALHQRHLGLLDISAHFSHRVTGGFLTISETESGIMQVKRPGKWRFEYIEPESKLFVSNGKTIYAYFPEERQVITGSIHDDAGASNPAAFLSGRGNLVRDFTATYADSETRPDTVWTIRLVPKNDLSEYEWLELTVERDSLAIMELSTIDFQGAVSTFVFSAHKNNQNLSDRLFNFEIPQDADVITDDSFGLR